MKRWVVTIGLLTLLVVGGCASRSSTATKTNREPPAFGASELGTRGAGDDVRLAGGASLRVPQGWRAEFLSAGALTRSAKDGREGAILFRAQEPYWGRVVIRVYSSESVYREQYSAASSLYRKAKANPKRDPYRMLRVALDRSDVASLTAFVLTDPAVSRRRTVIFYAQGSNTRPLDFTVELEGEPRSIESSAGLLPSFLLDYFDLKFR